MSLYRITIKVRPTPKHPAYWDIQFGFLNLFLVDEDADNAVRRALAICGQLPYERVGERLTVTDEIETLLKDKAPRWKSNCIVQCANFGFSDFLEAWQVGTDEAAFINSPYPGELQSPEA